MKAILFSAVFSLSLAWADEARAALQVFACEPEWAALVGELGGEDVKVFTATTAHQDPHRIEARPSLIAQVRRADLLVCTGAELESGWLPVLLRQGGNRRVQPGQPGYFEAAAAVERLNVPTVLDRSLGDLHPSGNPHVHLDPRRLATIAQALVERLAQIDAGNAERYRSRHQAFASRWREALERWQRQAVPLRGKRAVVYHTEWTYLFDWLGLVEAGSLEPRPGLPPSPAYLAELKARLAADPAQLIVYSVYQDKRPAEWLAAQTATRATELPSTVGAAPSASDLFGLFDTILERLLAAAR